MQEGRLASDVSETYRKLGRDQSRRRDGVGVGVVPETRKSRCQSWTKAGEGEDTPVSLGGYGINLTPENSSGSFECERL